MLSYIGPCPDLPVSSISETRPYPSFSRRMLLISSILLALAKTAIAQSTIPLTLAESEDRALASEPGRLVLQAEASALEAQAVVAGQLPDPVLRIGLNNYPIESGGFSTEGMTHAALGVRQAFPAGGTREQSSRKFEMLAEEKSENAALRERNVLNSTRRAWLSLYFWNRAHDLVQGSRPYFEDLATITRSLYAVGRNSQQDVLRAELELGRLEDRLIDIEWQRNQAKAALSKWIGDHASRPVAARFPAWNRVPLLDELRASLREHPALKASDARIAARDAGVELARQRARPEWALELGYSYRDGMLPGGQPRSDFLSLNVTVGLPFFRKRSVDSTLTSALHERSAATAQRQQLVRELEARLATEHTRWTDLSRRLAVYEDQIVKRTKEQSEASLLAYQSERGDFADVMRAYIDELNARIEFERLRVERAQSYAAIANLGGLPR